MHGSPRTCCGTLRGSSRTSSSRSWTAAPSGDPPSAKTSGRRSRTNCCPVWGRSQGARTIDGIVLKRFISSLRVAETVWMEGVFLKDYPPEAYTIKCLEVNIICHHHPKSHYPKNHHPKNHHPKNHHPKNRHPKNHHPKNHHLKNHHPKNHHPKNHHAQDSLALLATEGGQQRFEKHLKSWMKKIQANIDSENFSWIFFSTCQELLFESEQLRRETDDLGPQVLFSKGFVFINVNFAEFSFML